MGEQACGATFETASGYVVSCVLAKGHTNQHQGRLLGSDAVWSSNKQHDSEYEQYLESQQEDGDE